jgi:hypothetical protein
MSDSRFSLPRPKKLFIVRRMHSAYPLFFVSYLANVMLVGLLLRLGR